MSSRHRDLLNDPEHWLSRAEEARAIAGELHDPEARRIMERIADDYEVMARRAEERVLKKEPR